MTKPKKPKAPKPKDDEPVVKPLDGENPPQNPPIPPKQ